jgi:hypothetical protein
MRIAGTLHCPSTIAAAALAAGLAIAATPPAAAPLTCQAVSGPRTMPLVELFTSEGCDSCPPADRWLSAQFPPMPPHVAAGIAEPAALALAYHVDYWDRLGWRDRFASAQFTQRQYDEMRANGATFVYTPQVLLQGHDAPGWNRGRVAGALSTAERRPPRAAIALDVTQGANALQIRASATVADPTLRNSAVLWIAYADSGHVTEVAAGENRGARLRHDHVVRSLHGPFPMDAKGAGAAALTQKLPTDAGSAATVVAFVQDTKNGDVLQALALPDCR